jgi:DNA-binding transcriptional MerR regulator
MNWQPGLAKALRPVSTAFPLKLLESFRPRQQGFENMAGNGTATQTSAEKTLYRIGEVSRITSLKAFVLRYWESEFPMLQPVKSPSGHRLYRQEDVDLVLKIKRLLYDEGFTIAGARRHLRDQNGSAEADPATHIPSGYGAAQLLNRKVLLDLRDSLRAFLTLLERR